MTVTELIEYLQNPSCPKDAEIECDVVPSDPKPDVVWWSDDRKTVYLGYL